MIHITVSQEIRTVCPNFIGAAIQAQITNTPYSQGLWEEIDCFCQDYKQWYTTKTIKTIPSIQATREIYKLCGKDPSRYRPSAEALIRRILKGQDLYQIDTAVDLINLASIACGYSIGGFDADKITGNNIELGIGKPDEPYQAIGRGQLNIQGLPVYRDELGGIGTPTSDNERTKIQPQTTNLLALINGYDGRKEHVMHCATYIQDLLKNYANSDGGQITMF